MHDSYSFIGAKFVKLTVHDQKLSCMGTVFPYTHTHLHISEKYEFLIPNISRIILATFYTFSSQVIAFDGMT